MKKRQYLPFISSILYSSPFNQFVQTEGYCKQFLIEQGTDLPKEAEQECRYFDNHIEILVRIEKKQQISLNLFNQQGKLVRSVEIAGESGLNLMRLDNLEHLSVGHYYLQLNREGETMTRKITKQ